MFYVSPEGDRYYLGRAFTYGGFQYSRGGATHDKFVELGFTPVTIEQRPDDRYYIVSGPDNTGAYSSTPRDLDRLKLNFIMEQKRTARQLLSGSDWYVIRFAELEIETPAEWTAYRANVRAMADIHCDQIGAVTTVEELEALMKEPAEVAVESDTAPEGYVMIDNPDPHLEPWPEAPNEAAAVATGYDPDVDTSIGY
jgi:hypothetical protein